MYNRYMGAFRTKVRFSNRDGDREQEVLALVDTGAAYSVIPESILRHIGIEPTETMALRYANGRLDVRPMGEGRATIGERSRDTLLVFGPDGTEPLLGAYTLEGLKLMVDPPNQQLVPLPAATA